MELSVGDRAATFLELGPAHTGGDTIVHVPDAGTVFTGDLLFIDGTPGADSRQGDGRLPRA
jgi:cyclase